MTTPHKPLDRRAFLSAAASAGAMAALGNFSDVFGRWPLIPGESHAAWPQGRPFEIVALGDSIMWGQGLSEDPAKNQKFTFKVQRFVQEKLPGTEVHLHNFAHSGAQILADDDKDTRPADHGEIPNYFPSITWQLHRAVAELRGGVQRRYVPQMHGITDPASVGLVLLDGGINDIGTKKILTPDPTILANPADPASGAEWVRRATREQCVDRMETLLSRVLTTFPNARVVITNYYAIASSQSEPKYLWELLRIWDVIDEAMEFSNDWMMKKLAAQSVAFHDEYTRGLRKVVAEARSAGTVANAPESRTVQMGAPRRAAALPAAQPRRVALAEVPFGPRNSYAAPDTHLFYLNEPDPAASARKPACLAKYGVLNPLCTLAAGGHPNVRGAELYASAVIGALKQLVPEWQASSRTDLRNQPQTRP
jgi:lysophospholipase L1-like esterase